MAKHTICIDTAPFTNPHRLARRFGHAALVDPVWNARIAYGELYPSGFTGDITEARDAICASIGDSSPVARLAVSTMLFQFEALKKGKKTDASIVAPNPREHTHQRHPRLREARA